MIVLAKTAVQAIATTEVIVDVMVFANVMDILDLDAIFKIHVILLLAQPVCKIQIAVGAINTMFVKTNISQINLVVSKQNKVLLQFVQIHISELLLLQLMKIKQQPLPSLLLQ